MSPYLLQELCTLKPICDEISIALDTMYKAKFSTKTQSRHIIHQELRKARNIKLRPSDLKVISGPALLQRQFPLETIEISPGIKETNMEKIENVTANERARFEFHEHHRTCHKGCNGFHGCRFAKKSGISNGTRPVLLVPIEPLEKNESKLTCNVLENDNNQRSPSDTNRPNKKQQRLKNILIRWNIISNQKQFNTNFAIQ